jgi:hypothetical protein
MSVEHRSPEETSSLSVISLLSSIPFKLESLQRQGLMFLKAVRMKSTSLRNVTSCSQSPPMFRRNAVPPSSRLKSKSRSNQKDEDSTAPYCGLLLGLCFNNEDGGRTFLRNLYLTIWCSRWRYSHFIKAQINSSGIWWWCTIFWITGFLDFVQWLMLALSKGPNRVGVFFLSPEDGNRSNFRNFFYIVI